MHTHHAPVDIADLEVQCLAEAQAEAVGGQKVDLIAELAGAVDDEVQFLHRQHVLQRLHFGRLDDGDPVPGAVEYEAVEELNGVPRHLDGAPGSGLDQVQKVGLEVCGGQVVWTAVEKLGSLLQIEAIHLLGLGALALQDERIEVLLVELVETVLIFAVHDRSPQ